jgi:hypothetical protein
MAEQVGAIASFYKNSLAQWGKVTSVISATQCAVTPLGGFGNNFFANWQMLIVRKADGTITAPHNERSTVSSYISSTGQFTHAVFTTSLAVGDEVLVLNVNALGGVKSSVADTAAENWNSGVATSGAAGGDVVVIGAAGNNYEIHSLIVDISNMTVGATITIRLYQVINATERMVYSEDFIAGTDPDGIWVINSPLGIHQAMRVELYSNNALDDAANVDYDYMFES